MYARQLEKHSVHFSQHLILLLVFWLASTLKPSCSPCRLFCVRRSERERAQQGQKQKACDKCFKTDQTAEVQRRCLVPLWTAQRLRSRHWIKFASCKSLAPKAHWTEVFVLEFFGGRCEARVGWVTKSLVGRRPSERRLRNVSRTSATWGRIQDTAGTTRCTCVGASVTLTLLKDSNTSRRLTTQASVARSAGVTPSRLLNRGDLRWWRPASRYVKMRNERVTRERRVAWGRTQSRKRSRRRPTVVPPRQVV